jgi:serine/threonine protein kinase
MLGGAYIVESFLGQGGMGAVYAGLQLPLHRPVAIKILARGQAAGFAFEERFRREAYAMAALTHPNIVRVYDFGNASDAFLFISMEFVAGGDLGVAMKEGRISFDLALKILPQICDGLQVAHERGIIHRDIKPANIFLMPDGRPKVADFGLAKRFDRRQNTMVTQTGMGLGTPDYAAPEQYEGRPDIDGRADIFALGIMMYQMLVGHVPRGAWKNPSSIVGTDPQLDLIVLKAIEYEREHRYQTVVEMKEDILRIAATRFARAIPTVDAHFVPSDTGAEVGPPMYMDSRLQAQAPVPVEPPIPVAIPVSSAPRPAPAGVKGTRPQPAASVSHTSPTPPGMRRAAPARRPVRAAASPSTSAPVPVRPARRRSFAMIAAVVCATLMAALGALAIIKPSAQGRRVELIDSASPRGAPIAGIWTADVEGLHCTALPMRSAAREDERMRIYDLHYSPPGEYDFEIEFTRHSGSLVHVLSAGGHTFIHELKPARDQESSARSGLNGLDGTRLETAIDGYALVTAPPPDGTRHVVTVQVRHDQVRSLLDGVEIVRWQGDLSRLALPDNLRLGGAEAHLGLACRGGEITFHRATVREVSGTGVFSLTPAKKLAPGITGPANGRLILTAR